MTRKEDGGRRRRPSPISSPPTVALDLRLAGYAAGIAQYGRQLARALGALEGPERYVVLRGRRGPSSIAPGLPHRLCVTPPHHPLERWVLPAEIIARGRPSLLHSIDHVSPAWGPWSSVVTVHDLAFLRYPETHTAASRRYYAAARGSIKAAARVIAVSRCTATDIETLLHLDTSHVRVVYEAASPAFSPRPIEELDAVAARFGLDLSRPYVLFVGTLEPRKNIPLLLEALALLRRERDLQLVLASSPGWLSEPIYATRARLGLEPHAQIIGPLAEDDLAALYSHAAVCALPSLYEGFGLVVLEAMACGAPVVCSDAGPLPEIAGDAAVLLAPEDPSAWAAALLNVIEDTDLAARLRARGFHQAGTFSWERAARETRAVYRDALQR